MEVYTAQLKFAFCWMKVITLNSCGLNTFVLLSLDTLGSSCSLSKVCMCVLLIYIYVKAYCPAFKECSFMFLLHYTQTWREILQYREAVQTNILQYRGEYQVLLLYMHDLGRETSSWRDGKCLGLMFSDKIWGCISKNRAGTGQEDRLASVTCGRALSFSALWFCTAGVG